MTEPLYGTPQPSRPPLGPLSPLLDRSSTSAQADAEALRALGAAERPGDFYQRLGHRNGREFESLVAALEGADGAVSFASGMGAMSATLAAHLSSGDRVLVAQEVYGGTAAFATQDLPRFGVEVDRFSSLDLASLRAQLGRPAKMVVFESPINPTLRVVDIEAVVAAAREAGASTVFDGTFSPPPIHRVLDLGVDLVVHSATKFFGGHSDVLAGVVAGRHAHLGPIESWRRRTGGLLAPDVAWLLQRSWPTLSLRVQAQQDNALALARGLQELARTGALAAVTYPGLEDHPDREIVARQMQGGGAVLSFELPGGMPAVLAALDRLQVIARGASLGGVETLATAPAYTTHAPLSPQQRADAGISDGLMRIAVGLEPVEELMADLRQAISGVRN